MAPIASATITFILALIRIAFYTLFERKFLALAQRRKGPNKVSLAGLPQPLADALKLFLKQQATPTRANQTGFIVAPAGALVLALILWIFYPHTFPAYLLPFGTLAFLTTSSLNVYPTLIAGWSSNRKYALLGTTRRIAQTISYEISIALLLISVLTALLSFNFTTPLINHSTPLFLLIPPLFMAWFVTLLAETNRAPFDFAEGESELVSGFNIEYGGGKFALIFIAEYCNILVISLLSSTLFLLTPIPLIFCPISLLIITTILAALFIWVRAALPRMRYDQLMIITWKSFLPFSLCLLFFIPTIISLIS